MLGPNAYVTPVGDRCSSTSFLHGIHPLCKLIILICFTILTFSARAPEHSLGLFALLGVGYALAGVSLRSLARRLRLILTFGLMIIFVQLMFTREGHVLMSWELGSWVFSIYAYGLSAGILMAFRFINVITASHLFVLSTDPNRLAHSLMNAGLPYVPGFMLITALRFVPVFQHELQQIRHAQQAKGIRLDRSWRSWWQGVRYLLLPVVVSALSKVDTLTVSMEGRAFGLHRQRTFRTTEKISALEVVAVIMAVVMTAGYVLLPALAS